MPVNNDNAVNARLDRVLARKDDIVSRDIAGETFLVPIRGDLADMQKIFTLDTVAAFIWDSIDGKRALSDILDSVTGKFDVTRESAAADLEAFYGELLENGLILEL
ncbi:MAG: PqqD family protein [Deltaproteobacteria bacterium]|nr:PqqD family protein [Deltaproteobacteria bacterium]